MSLHGNVNFVELTTQRRYNLNTGWSLVRRWRGAKQLLSTFLGNQVPAGYANLEIEEEGAIAMVTATYATEDNNNENKPDVISRVWTLVGNDIQRPLAELPKYAELTFKDPELLIKINAAIDAFQSELQEAISKKQSIASIAFVPPPVNNGTPLDNQMAIELAQLIRREFQTFDDSQYVLRKTETVYGSSSVRPAHVNVRRYLTYASLLASEPTLPSAALIDASNLQGLYWLKRTPTVEQTNRGQFQITQEYWGTDRFEIPIYQTAI